MLSDKNGNYEGTVPAVWANSPIKPVQRGLLVPLGVTFLFLLVGFVVVLIALHQHTLDQASRTVLDDISNQLSRSLAEQSGALCAVADMIEDNKSVCDALKARDRQHLLEVYERVFTHLRSEHSITHLYFHGSDRVNILRVHKPEKHGDLIERFTIEEAERTGHVASGIELGPLGTFTLRSVVPVFDDDTLIGYIETGKEIEDILGSIAQRQGIELAVSIHKKLLKRTQWEAGMKMLSREAKWDRFPRNVLVFCSLPELPAECNRFVDETGHEHRSTAAEVVFNERCWRVLVTVLVDASGKEVGDLIILSDVQEEVAASERLVLYVIGVTLALLIALISFLYVALRRIDSGIRIQQAKLSESEERYDLAMSVANDGIWDWNLIEKTVIFDARYYSMAGYEYLEFPSTFSEWERLLHPDDVQQAKAAIERYVGGDCESYETEFRLKRKDGTYMWIQARGRIVARDQEGKPTRFVGTHSDITIRKNWEEALAERHGQFLSMLEGMDDVVYVADPDSYEILYMNRPARENWGDRLGDKCFKVLQNLDAPCSFCTNDKILGGNTGKTHICEMQNNANERWFRCTDRAIKWPDGRTVRYEMATDITETKRLQALASRAERLELAGTIAGQVAHDFNNLLGPMLAYPELIREELPVDAKAQVYLNAIEDASAKIRDINQDLLTLGRRGHYNQNVMVLNDVVRHSIAELKSSLRSVTVELNLCDELMYMKGGEAQIDRVITNLVLNALDAVQEGGTIALRTENYYASESSVTYGRIPQGEYIKLTVSDNGCGIAADVLQSILDPFFSTKVADRRRGSGLGLSVVDSVVRDHGGYLDLSSKVGQGTSFYLYFPVTRDSIDDAGSEDATGGSESVLVVDDDEIQRDVLSQLLSKLGYEVCAVECGETALELQIENPRDLVILDMIMPGGMDGAETYRRLLEILPEQRAIVVSGYAESDRIREAQRLGVDTIVKKPVTMSDLAGAVRKALDRDRAPALSI